MKKLYERESQLLQRRRVAIEIPHEKKATPKREDIKKQLASELKTDEKLISIKHIYTNYGENKSKVIIHIYKNEEVMKKLEKKKTQKGDKEAPKLKKNNK